MAWACTYDATTLHDVWRGMKPQVPRQKITHSSQTTRMSSTSHRVRHIGGPYHCAFALGQTFGRNPILHTQLRGVWGNTAPSAQEKCKALTQLHKISSHHILLVGTRGAHHRALDCWSQPFERNRSPPHFMMFGGTWPQVPKSKLTLEPN
jgi:hypothetical protein